MTIADCIQWAAENFGAVMFFLAVLIIIIHLLMARPYVTKAEIVYRWMALFPLGLTAIYAFIIHAFFPVVAATSIGWATSPFQTEVAMANLAVGVLGVLSFRASYGFRLATTIAAICWLGGDAVVHIYQIIRNHNFASGNAGTWLILAIVVPIILVACLVQLRKEKKAFRIR